MAGRLDEWMNDREYLRAWVFDDWLGEVQAIVPGNVVIVYDACRSANFIAHLDPPQGKRRFATTSSNYHEPAMFAAHGSLSFSFLFWGNMFVGHGFYESYVSAKNGIYLAFGMQNSQIDANGNGVPNEEEDKALARGLHIGAEIVTGGDIPNIGDISPNRVLRNGSSGDRFRLLGVDVAAHAVFT